MFLFRWVFRDPQVDLRFLAAGAMLPDLIDLTLGTLIWAERYSSAELWGHSLLAPVAVLVMTLVLTRRGEWRRRFIALGVGMFLHLLLDGMWTKTEVFWWPLAGWVLPDGPRPFWAGWWGRLLADVWVWVRNGVGLVYLVTLAASAGMAEKPARSHLVRTGRLPSDG